MKKFLDYYSILQVHHSAELDVISSAYKKLSKKYHPDLNNAQEAIDRMKIINIAYDTLSNPEKRERYHKKWLEINKNELLNQEMNIDSNTGLLNKDGFMDKAAIELYKYKRYGFIFSICMFKFIPVNIDDNEYDVQIKLITKLIKDNIRFSDFAGIMYNNIVLVLLPGTDDISAQKTIKKLVNMMQYNQKIRTSDIDIYTSAAEHSGNKIKTTINTCIKRLKVTELRANKII